MGNGAPRLQHIEALDGVRGLAVLLVIAFHLHWLGLGWVGVQLFFVLSGFLITRILLRDAQQADLGTYLRNFYLRRVLRIMPLYFGYAIAAGVILGTLGLFWSAHEQLAYVFSFTFNFYQLGASSQAPGAALDYHVFSHFWSLCVEEHFYLFWPLIVFALGKKLRGFALALILLGPVLRGVTLWGWPHLFPALADGASAVYKLSTSHLDAFATGAILCFLPRPGGEDGRRATRLFVVGLVAAAVLGWLANHGWSARLDNGAGRRALDLGFPILMSNASQPVWGYTVINILGGWLLWLAMNVDGFRRVFAQRWLRYTGKISFGMYVLHFPLMMVLAKVLAALEPAAGRGTVVLAQVAYVGLVYLAATCSYRWYELRFLRLKDQLSADQRRPARAAPNLGLPT